MPQDRQPEGSTIGLMGCTMTRYIRLTGVLRRQQAFQVFRESAYMTERFPQRKLRPLIETPPVERVL